MLLGMKVAAAALQGCALEQVAHPAVKLRLGTVRSVVHQLAALYPGTQLADGRHTWFAFCEPAVAVCAKTHPPAKVEEANMSTRVLKSSNATSVITMSLGVREGANDRLTGVWEGLAGAELSDCSEG